MSALTVWCLCDVCWSLSCYLSVSESKATHVCFSNSSVCVHSLSCLSVSQRHTHICFSNSSVCVHSLSCRLSVSLRHTHICSSKRSIIYQRLYLTIFSSVSCFSCVSSWYGAGFWVKETFLIQLKVCMCIGATGCGHVLRKLLLKTVFFLKMPVPSRAKLHPVFCVTHRRPHCMAARRVST